MKKILIPLFVLALIVASCLPNPGSPSAPATQTPYVLVVTATPLTAATTESATPTTAPTFTAIPATVTQAPTITPMPTNVPADLGTTDCRNHGVTAWQNDNMVDGSVYGEAPVGGLDETCWVVAQTWWVDSNGTSHRAVFAVRPHTVVWLSGHKGGTGWYFSGDLASVKTNLAEQAAQLLERDGEMDTLILILSDDEGKFPILTRFQVKKQ